MFKHELLRQSITNGMHSTDLPQPNLLTTVTKSVEPFAYG
jgi:hypothetical protein